MRTGHKPAWQVFIEAADKAQGIGEHALAVEFLECALDGIADAEAEREREIEELSEAA